MKKIRNSQPKERNVAQRLLDQKSRLIRYDFFTDFFLAANDFSTPGSYQRLDLFIKVLRVFCPNLTDAPLNGESDVAGVFPLRATRNPWNSSDNEVRETANKFGNFMIDQSLELLSLVSRLFLFVFLFLFLLLFSLVSFYLTVRSEFHSSLFSSPLKAISCLLEEEQPFPAFEEWHLYHLIYCCS